MGHKATVLLLAGILLFTWSLASSGVEFTDLGDGLLMRADGSVTAAWELPGCELADSGFEMAEGNIATPGPSAGVWRARFEQGW